MFDDLKQYINRRITYTKLEVVDSVSNMVGAGVFGILVGMFVMMILFVASLSAGFLFGSWFNNFGLGFLTVLAFYLIILVVVWIYRKKIMEFITDKSVQAAMEAIDNSEETEDED